MKNSHTACDEQCGGIEKEATGQSGQPWCENEKKENRVLLTPKIVDFRFSCYTVVLVKVILQGGGGLVDIHGLFSCF